MSFCGCAESMDAGSGTIAPAAGEGEVRGTRGPAEGRAVDSRGPACVDRSADPAVAAFVPHRFARRGTGRIVALSTVGDHPPHGTRRREMTGRLVLEAALGGAAAAGSAPAAPAGDAPHPRRRVLGTRFWLLNAGCWLGISLFFYSRSFLIARFARGTRFFWWQDGLEALAIYGQWALYTPLVVWASRRHSLLGRWRWGAIGFHVLLSCAVAGGAVLVQTFLASRIWVDEPQLLSRHFSIFFHWQVVFYWLVLSVVQGLQYQRKWQRNQLRAVRLETELARAELDALKMQMEPHFLFNTLHTISEMVHTDPAATEQMIVRLGLLLRHTMESAAQEVPLRREVEFLRAYLEIEQARFHDRLTICFDVPEELLECPVPTLILQPLVENAIRHGTCPLASPGTVRISAWRRGGALVLRVADNGAGLRAPGQGGGAGVGLRNLRSRLRHLYGERGVLELKPGPAGGVEATVVLPCHGG